MKQEEILSYKEYADAIRQKVDLVINNSAFKSSSQASWFPADLPKVLTNLQEAAQRTIENASSPVKIGIMGEFNAGKTLLIGSLIGFADALPVSANPTTGNVTAIRLVPQESLQTTQITAYTVEYLDEIGVQKCLRYMLDEAATRANAAGLTNIGEVFKNLNLSDQQLIENLIEGCKQAWNASNNPDLRYLIRELIVFVHTYKLYGKAMSNQSYTIDAETAEQGLKLTPPPNDIQNLSFTDMMPAASVVLENKPQKLSIPLLQSSFSLIRRVSIEVKISTKIWNLSPLKGVNEFILLDFPGLGAANSGVRDSFLSLNELENVQTILILLNGESPGSDRAGKIFTMLQNKKQGQNLKDRIIVGVGRFDKLPLRDDGEDIVLQGLIKSASPFEISAEDDPLASLMVSPENPLTEPEVLAKLKILNTTISTAQAFTTRKDRILLLSPLLGLAELKQRSQTIQIGSPQFLVKLETPGFIDEAERMRECWRKLSLKLLKSNPQSELGKQLSYFADDGSIGKLRDLLQNHVSEYGLQQVCDDTSRDAQKLRAGVETLRYRLSQIKDQGIPVEENPNVPKLRQIIENLYNIYNEFRSSLDQEVLKDRSQVPLNEVIYRELTFKVFNWSEWNSLFQRSQKGIITLPENDILGELLTGLDMSPDNNIPTKSDDFYPSFANTIQELEKFTRTLSRQAVTDLFNSLSAKLAINKEEFWQIIPREKLTARIQNLQDKNEIVALQSLVQIAIDPTRIQVELLKRCQLQAEENINYTTDPESIFPLAMSNASSNKNVQIFDWAKNSPRKKVAYEETPKPINHTILVLRLRDEMIACAGQKLVELVSELNQELNNTLKKILDSLIEKLNFLLQNEALLRYMTTDEVNNSSEFPDWLEILESITSINYPTKN